MSEMSSSQLEGALELLGEYLAFAKAEPVHLLVVGGSALAATGLISRATYDLDVFARRGLVDKEILEARPLPDSLLGAAEKVAAELKLRGDWINANVSLFALPLEDYPGDFLSDLEERDYGSHLSITFLGRAGLIYLKFHAAIDPQRRRRAVDLEDLRKLNPNQSEIRRTFAWLRSCDLVTSANEEEAHEVLEALHYEDRI